jgi:hypothetical protein
LLESWYGSEVVVMLSSLLLSDFLQIVRIETMLGKEKSSRGTNLKRKEPRRNTILVKELDTLKIDWSTIIPRHFVLLMDPKRKSDR